MRGDALHSAEHIRHVGAEDPFINMRLVNDDQPQMAEKIQPSRMIGQDAGVDHVGIGEDDAGLGFDCRTGRPRRVAVVNEDAVRVFRRQTDQAFELVLRQSFRGEDEDGGAVFIGGEHIEDRDLVDEALPAGCTGRDDDVLPICESLQRLALMTVEHIDIGLIQGMDRLRPEPCRHGRVFRLNRRDGAGINDLPEALFSLLLFHWLSP